MESLSHYIHKSWRAIIPYYLRKRISFYRLYGGNNYQKKINNFALKIGEKRPIKVLFIVSNLPMWRGESLYNLLQNDKRFEAKIIITPFSRYNKEESIRQVGMLKKHFVDVGVYHVSSVTDENFNIKNWLDEFDPDIVFPCQHYTCSYDNCLDIEWNMHRLMAYIPYGTPTMQDQFVYNTQFHNLAWRVYHATPLHLKSARKLMANNAINVRITGEPDFDKFKNSHGNPWKEFQDGKPRKRIIWAPHFSIDRANNILHRASFLWMYEEMLKLAQKYKDSVQFVFKPHPHLFITLVHRSDWGREKAEEYYNQWASSYNTQISEGDFIDLFKTSDAMIHDCGSFTGEYMMTGNPVMFMTKDIDNLSNDADDFGSKCLDVHYFGQNMKDVETFIDEIVIKGNDPKYESRKEFKDKMFQASEGTVAERIYSDILKGLGLE